MIAMRAARGAEWSSGEIRECRVRKQAPRCCLHSTPECNLTGLPRESTSLPLNEFLSMGSVDALRFAFFLNEHLNWSKLAEVSLARIRWPVVAIVAYQRVAVLILNAGGIPA